MKLTVDTTGPGEPPFGGFVSAGSLGAIVEELRDGFYMVEFGGEEGEPTILTLPGHSLTLEWSAPK